MEFTTWVCRPGDEPALSLVAEATILETYIFYRFHGKGLGRRLMEDVMSFARQLKSEKIWLQVHGANTHAIEFYKRFGFIQTGVDLFQAGKGSYRVLTFGLTFPR